MDRPRYLTFVQEPDMVVVPYEGGYSPYCLNADVPTPTSRGQDAVDYILRRGEEAARSRHSILMLAVVRAPLRVRIVRDEEGLAESPVVDTEGAVDSVIAEMAAIIKGHKTVDQVSDLTRRAVAAERIDRCEHGASIATYMPLGGGIVARQS
jgi:hypothetical protein